jgi:hypothetical protein
MAHQWYRGHRANSGRWMWVCKRCQWALQRFNKPPDQENFMHELGDTGYSSCTDVENDRMVWDVHES